MVDLLWLLVFGITCSSGFGSMCSDTSVCNKLSGKDQILDCLLLCVSESPDLLQSAKQEDDEDDDLLLSIILSSLASEGKSSESDLNVHSDARRSYSMEHFRWGKPSGRKRRPIKVFLSSLDGGDSPGSSFLFRARRHLDLNQGEAKMAIYEGSQPNQGLLRSRVSFRSHDPSGLPERRYGSYRMSHFRWGSPPASKHNNRFLKMWEEKHQGHLTQFIKNLSDVQRKIG